MAFECNNIMKTSLPFLIGILLVSMVHAEQLPTFLGRGDWGRPTLGVRCRATLDKTEYELGEPVRVLIEVRNETDKPVALGLEPLIEVDKDGRLFRQPAEIVLAFSQGNPGFFATYSITFPKGNGTEARAVVIEPKATFSEIITRFPWGPTYGSSPAQPGAMMLKASLSQFLSLDLKKTAVHSQNVTFNVKASQNRFEPGGAANGSLPAGLKTNRTSSAADSRR
jgi:hypothetical protein